LSSYLITVARSGERKSACDTEAMWPIRRREAAFHEQYENDAVQYTHDKTAYDAARASAIKHGEHRSAKHRLRSDRNRCLYAILNGTCSAGEN